MFIHALHMSSWRSRRDGEGKDTLSERFTLEQRLRFEKEERQRELEEAAERAEIIRLLKEIKEELEKQTPRERVRVEAIPSATPPDTDRPI